MSLKTESALATLNERGVLRVQIASRGICLAEGEGSLSSQEQCPEHTRHEAARGLISAEIREEMNPDPSNGPPNAASCTLPLSGPAPAKRTPHVLPLSPWASVLIQSLT